ncbi:MAG: hypothetical protein M3O91_09695 [Chloroflexota bacterium]|nr:hypothetical protein [Chloroflexota bacterium]
MARGYLLRTIGGPAPVTRVVDYPWPLPDELPWYDVAGGAGRGVVPKLVGRYVKVRESHLPSEVDEHPNVMRGAEYEWRAESC